MGKPATAYFCGNGHCMENNAHHEFGPRDTKNLGDDGPTCCQFCGSTEEYMTLEWGDPDYDQEVPMAPIRHDEIECKDHKGNVYFKKIPVFDISALRARRRG